MKRIAFIIGSMGKGGAERVISILANEYVKKGFLVDIIMLLDSEISYDLKDVVNVIDYSTGKKKINSIFYWFRNLRGYSIDNSPDIMIAFSANMYFTTFFSTIGLNIPLIVSERSDPYNDGRNKLIDVLANFLYPKAKVVVLQSKRAKSYFSDKIKKNSVIIPNPIEVKTYASNNPSKKIVNVGRLIEAKNQKLLINSFGRIQKEYPEYELHLYGEGHLRKDLEKQITTLNLNDKVFIHGNVSNVHELISDSEIFVLSSNYEGLSNALLEAMMMGLPCISTDCGGSKEYIENGFSGFLIPINSEKSLYEAIKKMIDNRYLRFYISTNAKKSVEVCNVENVVQMWMKYL